MTTESQELLEAHVVECWKKYHVWYKVLLECQISQEGALAILRKHGLSPHVGRKTRLIPLPEDKIAEAYLAGKSTLEIGKEYGVSDEVIRQRLKKMGVQRRENKVANSKPGQKNNFWRGGPREPMPHFYRRQSYEAVAIYLQHPVPGGWIVHHLNGDYRNNAPENLSLFRSQAEHARYHSRLTQKYGRKFREAPLEESILLALETGARRLPKHPLDLRQLPHDIDEPGLWEMLLPLETIPTS